MKIKVQELPGFAGFYVASDENGMAITFQKGRFNETAEVLPQPGAEKLGAVAIASEIRRIGDWLALNAKELL